MQLLHAIPKSWKNDLSDVKENIHNLILQNQNLLLQKKNKLHQDNIIKRSSTIAILTRKLSTYWYALSQNTSNYVLFSLNY